MRSLALAAAIALVLVAGSADGQDRGNPRIFVADKNCENVRLLVEIPGMVSHGSPSWSHDGKLIVFDAKPDGNYALNRIYVYAFGGPLKGMWRHLGAGGAARFSPDNNWIAFQVRAGNQDGLEAGIYVMRDDGSERKRICDGLVPRWTKDGKSLLFNSSGPAGAALEIINFDGTGRRRVVGDAYASLAGCDPSPDGKEVCYIANPIGARETVLYRAPLDGSMPPTVVHRGPIGYRPAWSPDGKEILFWIFDEAGSRHLCVIDPDGKLPLKKLANQEDTRFNSDAQYSPDGERIAFSSDRAAAAP